MCRSDPISRLVLHLTVWRRASLARHLFCSTASKYFCFSASSWHRIGSSFASYLDVSEDGAKSSGFESCSPLKLHVAEFCCIHVYHVSTMSGEIHIRITRTMFCLRFWSNPRSMRQTAAACWHRPSKHPRRKICAVCYIESCQRRGWCGTSCSGHFPDLLNQRL